MGRGWWLRYLTMPCFMFSGCSPSLSLSSHSCPPILDLVSISLWIIRNRKNVSWPSTINYDTRAGPTTNLVKRRFLKQSNQIHSRFGILFNQLFVISILPGKLIMLATLFLSNNFHLSLLGGISKSNRVLPLTNGNHSCIVRGRQFYWVQETIVRLANWTNAHVRPTFAPPSPYVSTCFSKLTWAMMRSILFYCLYKNINRPVINEGKQQKERLSPSKRNHSLFLVRWRRWTLYIKLKQMAERKKKTKREAMADVFRDYMRSHYYK